MPLVSSVQVKRAARKAGGGSSPAKRDNPNLLTHGDFLNLLLRMAARIYPVSTHEGRGGDGAVVEVVYECLGRMVQWGRKAIVCVHSIFMSGGERGLRLFRLCWPCPM